MLNDINPKRLEIYMTDMPKHGGSIQCGYRPVIIVQNDMGNATSPNVIVVPLTTKAKHWLPTHVDIDIDTGLSRKSIALCEQIQTISKESLIRKIGEITQLNYIEKLKLAICAALAL